MRLQKTLRIRIRTTGRVQRGYAHDLEHADRTVFPPLGPAPHVFRTPRIDCGPTFAEAVGGAEPKPIDATLVRLADDVSKPTPAGSTIDGFIRLGSAELALAHIPSDLGRDAGLRFALYRNASGHTVLSFAGTDGLSWNSWRANLSQGMGFETLQYLEAGRIGKMAKLAYGEDLAMTGHSLGGGLAAFAALKSGAPAVTFNAAGLSDRTIARLSLDPAAARAHAAPLFRNFVCMTDPLTNLQHSRLGIRIPVAAAAGGVVGSMAGAAVGIVTRWSIGHFVGPVAAPGAGGLLGAAVAGVSAAAVTGTGMAQVRPALGSQIILPDPHSPARTHLWGRITHAVEIHRIAAIRTAMERAQGEW